MMMLPSDCPPPTGSGRSYTAKSALQPSAQAIIVPRSENRGHPDCMPHFHIQKCEVVVSKDAALFVRQWKTAFVWHVVDADPSVRGGDGVILVDENNDLLATWQAKLSRIRIAAIPSRAGVDVRIGWG